jgi:peptidoglycan/LPS O-acetylase OafA/YrhL
MHLQNYRGPVWLHTWSLAVEEHFYLAFPILLVLLTRLRSASRPPSPVQVGVLTILAVVGCTYLRLRGKPTVPINLVHSLVPTHLRIDGLLFGTTLAYVYHLKPTWFSALKKFKWPLLVVGIAAVSPMAVLPLETQPFVATWGFSLLYLGYGCVIVAVMSIDPDNRALRYISRMLVTRVLLVIGVSSYSIYLWHWHLARLPVMRFVAKHPLGGRPEWNWLVYTILYVFVATVVGYITGRLIEFPALRLRDRLFPRIARQRARLTTEAASQSLAD